MRQAAGTIRPRESVGGRKCRANAGRRRARLGGIAHATLAAYADGSALAQPFAGRGRGVEMTPLLDENRRQQHKARNQLQSALLVGGLGLVTAFSAWLLW